MSLYISYAVTGSSVLHLLFVFKRFINDSCLNFFRRQWLCVAWLRAERNKALGKMK